ncbi:MAG: DNA-binding winged helix-turn-helix (wHTH) protein [Candidatus Azotimanducaceae bacterium]|jgi:DNA-binding winged helix-turn-helix (wHTH) protein
MDVLVHLVENSDRIVSASELLETFCTNSVVEESTTHPTAIFAIFAPPWVILQKKQNISKP